MPTLRFDDFTGGLVLPGKAAPTAPEAGDEVPSNALLAAENVGEFLPSGGIRGRRGRTLFSEGVAPGRARALSRYYALTSIQGTGHDATVATNAASGGAEWFDTGLFPSLNDAAKVDLSDGATSRLLHCTGLGFSLPSSAVVAGIQVEIFHAASVGNAGAIVDGSVRLLKAGVVGGDDRAVPEVNWLRIPSRALSPDPPYGGAGDLWGEVWTADDINDPGFGVAISAQATGGAGRANVLLVRITVFVAITVEPRTLFCHYTGGEQEWSHLIGADVGAFTALPGGTGFLQSAERPRIITWPEKRKAFIFDGLNPLLSYDGTRIAVVDGDGSGLVPRRGRASALWKNRLWATEPAERSFSVYASAINDETSWPPNIQFSVNDDQGGTIQALCGFGDRLVVLKDTSLWFLTGDIEFGPANLVQYSTRGCIAPDTVAATPFGVIYLARDGLRLTDGSDPDGIELSASVRVLFVDRDQLTLWRDAVGIYFPRRDQYWLKLDPSAVDGWILHRVDDGDGGHKLAWSHVPVLPMECACVWDGEADTGEILIGDADGLLWQHDTGGTDQRRDVLLGLDFFDPIPVEVQTAFRALGQLRERGRGYRLRTHYRGTRQLTGAFRYDEHLADDVELPAMGAELAAPDYQDPRATIMDQTVFGRSLSVRLATDSNAPEFELHSIDVDAHTRSLRAWDA